jgi:hypothetical protein
MLRWLIYAIVALSLYYILSEILNFLSAVSGGVRRIQKDSEEFLENLNQHPLVDWDNSELDLISKEVQINKFSEFFTSGFSGVIRTIYQEDIGVFQTKKYTNRSLIVIRTSTDQYVLKIDSKKENELQILGNEVIKTFISESGIVIPTSNIHYELCISDEGGEIKKNAEIISTLNKISLNDNVSDRLINFYSKNLNDEEGKIVKFLLVFYLIWQKINDH